MGKGDHFGIISFSLLVVKHQALGKGKAGDNNDDECGISTCKCGNDGNNNGDKSWQ
jgi:hypothetical protein